MSKTGYSRVYVKAGSYYFVDLAHKWHKLCRIDEGEPAMLRALARVKDRDAYSPETMPGLIEAFRRERLPQYAEITQRDYELMLVKIAAALRDIPVAMVEPCHVMDLRVQWADKPRSANKYQALLSVLMSFAIEKRLRAMNPCRDVAKLKTKRRRRYITDAEMLAIRVGALNTANGHRVPTGQMIVCLIDLAYLTGLRMGDLRQLTWRQITEDGIEVEPAKTQHSTGAKILIPVTPEIREVLERARSIGKVKGTTVIHNLAGAGYSKDGIETAWQRACARAGVTDAHFHDLRAKALSDAQRRGVDLAKLQDAAGHSSVTTTEGYLRGREVKVSALGLRMPGASNSGGQNSTEAGQKPAANSANR
jgi:integrase